MSAGSHAQASKIRVGVVRGGTSSEYPVSLKTGGSVIKHLPASKYRVHDILITRDGKWHFDGVEKKPEQILKHVDVIFNALHGEFGEDGKIQTLLDTYKAAYTGSGALASAMAMNKVLTKKHLAHHATQHAGSKIKTAVHLVLRKEEIQNISKRAAEIFKTFPHPAVVKPASAGSSIGVSIVSTLKQLEKAIHSAFEHGDTVLIEEYIAGKEATCGVIDHFRGEKHYVLPPVEIRKGGASAFFDYEAKYGGASEEICPGNFTAAESAEIQRMAREVHRSLGLKHYSRSDFIVHPRRGVYFLEVNTLPGLTEHSLFPRAMQAVGSGLTELVEHLVGLARGKY
ncbi:MAG: D-alanine--D-alanine ligase family protein [Patescibacteria group bacterium]